MFTQSSNKDFLNYKENKNLNSKNNSPLKSN